MKPFVGRWFLEIGINKLKALHSMKPSVERWFVAIGLNKLKVLHSMKQSVDVIPPQK